MSTQDHFPSELLAQSNRDRWLYFYHKIVAHPRLVEVDREGITAHDPDGTTWVARKVSLEEEEIAGIVMIRQ